MKRTSLVLCLALVLVFAFSATAMAKYAGYSYNTPGGGHVGYLSWAGAKAIMTASGIATTSPGLQDSPHGGYRTNTAKCAVCHSTHRAWSDRATAGVGTYAKLTPGTQACIACHTAWGANPIPTSLVEWANPADSIELAGPHSSFNCLGACHGSVHGGTLSEYGAVRAWNLTNRNDAAIAAAFTAGNVASNDNQPNSQSLASNNASASLGNYYYASFGDAEFRAYDYADGQHSTYPAQNSEREAMRAMATGYTCGASGCHSSSQFAVNTNGYAGLRASDPSASSTLDMYMTGHSTNMIGGCEPCHVATDNKCAACHDMKGLATNSSAFPHGNRGIKVIETNATGVTSAVNQLSGNLWMYAGDATWRDGSMLPSATGTVDQSRLVVDDAAGFHAGQAGDIIDGTCLKCHGERYFGPNYGGAYHRPGKTNGTYVPNTDFTSK